jgi:phosphomannomutase/phosphoglucomutase
MNKRIFREYDIRGQAERDLDDDLVFRLGRALCEHVQVNLATDHAASPTIAVGRDCRQSSNRLWEALTKGLQAGGASVVDIGVVSTPLLYFAAFHLKTEGAVIITGSHNPAEDNGFKMLRGRSSLYGDDIRKLQAKIEEDSWQDVPAGSLRSEDMLPAYLDYMESTLSMGEKRGKIVVDAGNGTGGPVAVALYERLGYEVIPLYCDMDGAFPNHHPDPTVEANLADLRRAVEEENADLGIALDGDADRIGAVDGKGRILWGDQLLILLGRALLQEEPGASIIGEVKCSQALYDELEKAGGKPIMSKVGHSLIKAKMKETKALLAGEMSGHIFFAHRFLGFDDGVYAGARLLELLSHRSESLAELYETLPQMVNTPEIRVECPDAIKFDVVAKVTSSLREHPQTKDVVDIDGVRAHFGDGWGLVRASNTQPSLVLRCEANNAERLAEIQNLLESEISKARANHE